VTERRRHVLQEVDPRRVDYGSLLFDGDAAWSPDIPVRVPERFTSCISDGWLRGAPDAFDTVHRETGRLVVTNHGVSPTILEPFGIEDLVRSVPTGYTNLAIAEKRAVVTDARLARLWTAEYDPAEPPARWAILIPDDGRVVTVPWGVADATGGDVGRVLAQALTLSRLMAGRSALVVRVLESHQWH